MGGPDGDGGGRSARPLRLRGAGRVRGKALGIFRLKSTWQACTAFWCPSGGMFRGGARLNRVRLSMAPVPNGFSHGTAARPEGFNSRPRASNFQHEGIDAT